MLPLRLLARDANARREMIGERQASPAAGIATVRVTTIVPMRAAVAGSATGNSDSHPLRCVTLMAEMRVISLGWDVLRVMVVRGCGIRHGWRDLSARCGTPIMMDWTGLRTSILAPRDDDPPDRKVRLPALPMAVLAFLRCADAADARTAERTKRYISQ